VCGNCYITKIELSIKIQYIKTQYLWVQNDIIHKMVRFYAYYQIKPHAPPLVQAPVNSFEF